MGLSAFLKQNALPVENEKHVISERFVDEDGNPIPWEIRALSEEENQAIRKSCTKVSGKKGPKVPETDFDAYLTKMTAASVVFPNLKDAELQKSYGVLGSDELLKTMLTAGEYARLIQVTQDVNGFRDMDELVEEAKN